jgi:fatty acid desaturase
MVPDVALRPEVLPTERLLPNGMCRPELRTELRRIAGRRNAWTVAWLWLWVAATVAVVARFPRPWVVAVAFLLMGPVHARLAILMHEAAHRLLFVHRRVNDLVGQWLVAAPAFVPIGIYRRGHVAHHRAEFGPDDPDIAYYGGYPATRRALVRRLTRDAVGISGWKNFSPLLRAATRTGARRIALPILGVQAALWAVTWVATGDWWIYPVLWWLPWMTQWRVLNRLRSLAEHGGMAASADRRATTHDVRQSWIARFWFVPYHAGWHLAHHVDMGIPWRNLPRYHEELRRAGYVTPALTHPSYRSLWRALSSIPAG